MAGTALREEHAQQAVDTLQRTYHAFARRTNRPGLRAEDLDQLRTDLEHSMRHAQEVLRLMDAQPGISADLKGLQDKLVILSTLVESDLAQERR
jgi:hypothetical protein